MQRNADADRIIRNVPWSQQKRQWPDEVYYDPVVHDAQLLYLLARHFPERMSGVPPAALEGMGQAISGNRVSSLSAAYTLLALDAYSKSAAPKVKLGIVISGQRQAATSKAGVPVGAASVQFTREGLLPAYYSVNESGFDRNPPTTEVSHDLEVIHEFLDMKGNAIAKVNVGDEFWVRLRVRTTNRERVNQIAVVDLLPGGVEPTLERQAGPGSTWTPEYVDRRDDRVVLYGDVTKVAATYVYKVRATNAGTFQCPPAFAEGMYNRQISAMSQAARLEIVKP
jgi:uncharacterized protein YfaS (alpha-2-macroglobulin family)